MNYCSNENIKWTFITELAPWKGGIYERIVRSIKNCFRKSILRKTLKFPHFVTFLTEVESILNNRPLTFIYEDSNSSLILKPIDFIQPKILTGIPDFGGHKDEYVPKLDNTERLYKAWKRRQIKKN